MTRDDQIERLAGRLTSAVPKVNAGEQALALALIRARAKGEPVSDHALAAETGAPASGVRDSLERWPAVFRDEYGSVVGFMGLSVVEFGEHRIDIDGRRLTAWCAWDTLFLPELLGRSVEVTSRCPVTGEAISLTVTAGGPSGVRPDGAVLSFLAPDRPFDVDVMQSFCHFVHFFAFQRAAEEWTVEHPGTFALPIEQGFRLGRLTNEAALGRALREERVKSAS